MKGDLPALRNCTICNHDNHDAVLREFTDGILSGLEASKKLDCTIVQFKRHIELHVKKDISLYTSRSIVEVSNSIVDKVGEMIDSLDRNKTQMDIAISEIKGSAGKAKRDWIETYLKSEKLLGDQVQKLALIQGELKASGVDKVQQLIFQFNKIEAVLVENVKEPKAKLELAKVLESIEKDNEEGNSTDL